jgi:hypothetical protein
MNSSTLAKPEYFIRRAEQTPAQNPDWDATEWRGAAIAEVSHFLKASSDHRPRTRAKLVYAEDGLHGIFKVEDRYVRSVRTNYFDEVWKDSAVEFFFQPRETSGYFNLECNCGGAFLLSYIRNPERTENGFREWTKVPWSWGEKIQVTSSLPRVNDPETANPLTWFLRFFVPFELIEHYAGAVRPLSGHGWRGNFYKCAEDLSHPHWAAWSPVDEFNFHLPRCFGMLRFE